MCKNVNDIIAYGADAEPVTPGDIVHLYRCVQGYRHGVCVWIMRKRKLQVRPDLRKQMKRDGEWLDEFNQYPTMVEY